MTARRLPDQLRPLLDPVIGSLRTVSVRVAGKGGGERLLLELDLTRPLLEAAPATPLEVVRSLQAVTLRGVVEALEKAAKDDDVAGLIAHVGGVGMNQAEELRTAVAGLRAAGKQTVAWAETYGEVIGGNAAFLAASAFEEVWVQPTGDVGLVGVTAQATFVAGTLDKLGVQTQMGQRHEYKSAANTFTQSEMTEPHREMMTRIVDSLTATLVEQVAQSRGLAVDDVRSAMDAAPLAPDDALARGLVDRVGYREDAYAALRERLGEPATTLRYLERYAKPGGPMASLREQLPGGTAARRRKTVAVVGAHGPIHLGRSNQGGSPLSGASIGSDTLTAAIRTAAADESVQAIVLRVDSPGGSAVASDAVRRAVLEARSGGTPVIASMGSVAASGGYYISMAADTVLAAASTLTGSIGVLGGKQVVSEPLRRIGVTRETVSAGRFADMFSTERPFDDEEWARFDAWLDRIYDDFTAKAAHDRGMDVEDLRALARGRVWTGADAVQQGLVDRIGGLSDAVDVACETVGIARARVDVRAWPRPNALAFLNPPESSEAPAAAGVGLEPLTGGGSLAERVLGAIAAEAGLPSAGVLTMPWRIRIG